MDSSHDSGDSSSNSENLYIVFTHVNHVNVTRGLRVQTVGDLVGESSQKVRRQE